MKKLTILDGDDWFRVMLDDETIYEGHRHLGPNLLYHILQQARVDANYVVGYDFTKS